MKGLNMSKKAVIYGKGCDLRTCGRDLEVKLLGEKRKKPRVFLTVFIKPFFLFLGSPNIISFILLVRGW